jgi:hypothetical protein
VTRTPVRDPHSLGLGLGGQPLERRDVVRIAATLLVQHDGDAGRLPVGEHGGHVFPAGPLTDNQFGVVSDGSLLGVDPLDIGPHDLRSDLDVSDAVVGERLRIGLPYADRMRHQLAHRGLEVVVPHHAACDARSSGGDSGLVEDEDVLAASLPGRAEPPGEIPRGREAVDPGTDDHVADVPAHAGTILNVSRRCPS